MHKTILMLLSIMLVSCTQPVAPPLRLGTNVWPGYEPLYLARHNGYLKKDRVHLVELSSATQVIQAYRNGLIDAAALTLDEVLLLLEAGERPKIVLVMDISDGGDVILAQAEITEFSHLQGKRVGVENNALGAYVLSRALEINELDSQSVQIVPLDINEQERAFKQREVDAVVSFDPVRSVLLKSGASLLFDSRQMPGEIVDVLVVRDTYLDAHADTVQLLLDAWYQAVMEFEKQPEKAAGIFNLRMKLGVNEVLSVFETLKLPSQKENQALLQSGNPKLLMSTGKLMQTMLKQQLLKKYVAPSEVFSNVNLLHR